MLHLLGNTSKAIPLFMADSTDHNTGKTGLSLTLTRRKAGGSFAAAGGSVAELANGWYEWTPGSGDIDTAGFLLVHATGTGADPADARVQVVAFDPYDAAALGLSRVDAAVSTRALEAGGNLAAVKAKTDALPASPATEGSAATAAAAAASADARAADLQARTVAALVGGRVPANAQVVGDKAGFSLASGGLDAISAPEPTGKPTTFVGWLMWLVQGQRRATMTSTQRKVLTEAGAVVTTQPVSDDGATQALDAPV